MSFAAVLALVAAYEGMRQPWREWRAGSGWGRRVALYLAALALSTLIAGTATGIIALHHFGRYSQYGLVANLIAIPLAGFWIMPWGVLACVLMPFGLEQLALAPMGWGIDLMLGAARTVASWPGASLLVPAMPAAGLALSALGGLWICLWRGRLRWGGAIGLLAGLATIPLADRPDVLVNGDGRLMAVRMADGRYSLSSTRREAFAARIWLERDGDVESGARPWPETASADGRLACDALGCVYRAGRHSVALVQDPRALLDDCMPGAVVVSAVPVRRACRAAGRVIDRFDLWRDGAHALWLKDGGRVEVLSVRQARGDRPWTHGPPRRTAPAENKMPLSTAASGRRGGPAP
jgi:competence protein ComEC